MTKAELRMRLSALSRVTTRHLNEIEQLRLAAVDTEPVACRALTLGMENLNGARRWIDHAVDQVMP